VRPAEDTRRVLLPGGYVDENGGVHTEVELAPLTGAGEELLLNAPPDRCEAVLATALLGQTIRRIGALRRVTAEAVRGLLVQDREFLIVRLREVTLGNEMWVRLKCPESGCGQGMELSLMLDELPVERRPVTSRFFPFDAAIEFRLPTGDDQEWAAASGRASDALSRGILGRCLRHPRTHRAVDPAALDQPVCDGIEEQMRDRAPDVTPELTAVCPECRTPFAAEVDMTYLVLCELKRTTRQLDEEVHMLAWHYHWPESEILSMSRRKRRRYVGLIEDQLEAASSV
jgi:hypothetical protein